MISGTLISTQASITGSLVFRRPALLNMVYSGMVNATGGRTRTSRIQYVTGRFRPKLNRRLASTYAAQIPTTRDSTREPKVVWRLLTIAVPNPFSVNSLAKCSIVRAWGISEMCPVISSVGRMAMASSQ